MVHLFLTQALAIDLREHLRTVPAFAGVVGELDAELGPGALALPCNTLPALSVWQDGVAVDYFDPATAEIIRAGITDALARHHAARREALPLVRRARGHRRCLI